MNRLFPTLLLGFILQVALRFRCRLADVWTRSSALRLGFRREPAFAPERLWTVFEMESPVEE